MMLVTVVYYKEWFKKKNNTLLMNEQCFNYYDLIHFITISFKSSWYLIHSNLTL